MRIVFDTNVLARAQQRSRGPARRALVHVTGGPDVLILSPHLLQELGRVLVYPKLLERSGLTPVDIAEYLECLARASTLVNPLPVPRDLLRDPSDEPVLGTALAGQADVICTRDADFFDEKVLGFGRTNGIRILTDIELLHALGVRS